MGPSRGWKPWAVNHIQLLIWQPALILLHSFPYHFYLQQMKLWGKDAGEWLVGAVVDQSFSSVQLFVTPWTAACQASRSYIVSQSLLRLMSIESVIPSNHPILCHPLLLLFIFPSIRVFSNELVLHIRWPKYWSFCFSISPSNEYSGLISFRMDWLDLLAVQGTLKCLLQHHSSKYIGRAQTVDGKNEHQHVRNQWTKMVRNGWI